MVLMLLAVLMQAPSLPVASPTLKTIDRGAMSEVDSGRQVVARTPAEWAALWRAHAPNRPAPAVNFATTMAVGVFLGTRPTGGFTVEIVRTREERGALVVEYIETRPAPDAIAAQILTSPFHIVIVPARAGDVRFEKVPK